MTSMSNPALTAVSWNPLGRLTIPDGPAPPTVKTPICNKFNTEEGCDLRVWDKCHFAHGERVLGKPISSSHDDQSMGPMMGRVPGRMEPPPPGLGAVASLGASATAKISVDASLAGAIIGKGGVNSKQIICFTGAELAIREHETNPNLRNIELGVTFDQIKQASAMVRELIVSISAIAGAQMKNPSGVQSPPPTSNNKTKLRENFAKDSCTFGDRCHFAHGASDLSKPSV